MTTVRQVRELLRSAGFHVELLKLPNGQTQISVPQLDAVANVWETGTCNVQGKEAHVLREILGDLVGKAAKRRKPQRRP